MRLADWLKWQGYGARAKLARDTGLTWESIQKYAKGGTPTLANALKIQAATGDEVTVAELDSASKPQRRPSKRKRRRRARTLAAAA